MAIVAFQMSLQQHGDGSCTINAPVVKMVYNNGKLFWWEPGEDTHHSSEHMTEMRDVDRLEIH